jgi:hypothetical protein
VECRVGKLYKPGAVASYLSQLPAAIKLKTIMCQYLESSSDIETILQTIPLLFNVKEVRFLGINLGERSLTLSTEMISIELVDLRYMTMSCSVLHDLITVVNKLPHTVTIYIRGCNIKPITEFEEVKKKLQASELFMVMYNGTYQNRLNRFDFKTIKHRYK